MMPSLSALKRTENIARKQAWELNLEPEGMDCCFFPTHEPGCRLSSFEKWQDTR